MMLLQHWEQEIFSAQINQGALSILDAAQGQPQVAHVDKSYQKHQFLTHALLKVDF